VCMEMHLGATHDEIGLKCRMRDACVFLRACGCTAIVDWHDQEEFFSLSPAKEGAAASPPYLCQQAGDLEDYGTPYARRRRSA